MPDNTRSNSARSAPLKRVQCSAEVQRTEPACHWRVFRQTAGTAARMMQVGPHQKAPRRGAFRPIGEARRLLQPNFEFRSVHGAWSQTRTAGSHPQSPLQARTGACHVDGRGPGTSRHAQLRQRPGRAGRYESSATPLAKSTGSLEITLLPLPLRPIMIVIGASSTRCRSLKPLYRVQERALTLILSSPPRAVCKVQSLLASTLLIDKSGLR